MIKRLFLSIAAIVAMASCQSSDDFGSLPRPVWTFVSQYWPNPDVASYTHPADDEYVVSIKNSATITFDASYAWTKIEGNGLPLPPTLLYDQLPTPLYSYLQSGQYTGEVFSLERTPRIYTVGLLSTSLTYDIASGTVRQE